MRLDGKVALISGGARGLGEAQARLFAQEGARVVIGDVLEDEGKKVEAEINEAGGDAHFDRLDVTQEDQWQRVIDATTTMYGKQPLVSAFEYWTIFFSGVTICSTALSTVVAFSALAFSITVLDGVILSDSGCSGTK